MLLPSAPKRLLRKYEGTLFRDDSYSKFQQVAAFHQLLKRCLPWIDNRLEAFDLAPQEMDSELFILASDVFRGYNKDKSSIIPYLERQLPWYLKKLFKRLGRTTLKEEPIGLTTIPEGSYEHDESFYWKNILFEDRWAGKCFTRGQKYIISLLIADDDGLSQQALARATNTERKRIKKMLCGIKETLEEIQ